MSAVYTHSTVISAYILHCAQGFHTLQKHMQTTYESEPYKQPLKTRKPP
ncbi:hypothetical protein PAV_9c02430 [Paenibacillus alvei DSM 29]|nr:hypothetical protein PAV_9c02430 [Paenibacillus alvei DSM 29]